VQVSEASGLVRSEKVGRLRTCRIGPAALPTARRWIPERRTACDASPAGVVAAGDERSALGRRGSTVRSGA
jgi:hypothetical protein